jgi:molecular chaperone DnaJ
VPTITGELELRIPAGTQPSDKLIMRGKGVKRLNGGSSGNQVVHIKLCVPKKLSKSQEALIRQFAAEEAEQSGEGTKSEQQSLLQSAIDRIRKALKAATGST